MTPSFFQLPEPVAQATQKIWQAQVAQTERLVAEAHKMEDEIAARTRHNLEETSRLVKSSFEYFFGLGESFRAASLAAMKDWSSFGSGASKAAE